MDLSPAPRSMSRFRVGLVLLGVGAVALAAYLIVGGRSGQATGQRSPRPSESATAAAIAPARGTLIPSREAGLAVAVPGAVAEILVAPGETVEAGQSLLRVDGIEQALAVNVAEADVRRARAVLAAANVERASVPRNATRGERRIASAAVDVADANLRFEQAALAAAKTEAGLTVLKAPFAGVVVAVRTELGEQIGSSDPVVVLADTSSWKSEALVPESVAVGLTTGDAVTVTLGSLPRVTLPGVILNIGPDPADSASSDQLVVIELSGTDPHLRPGLSTDIDFAGSE